MPSYLVTGASRGLGLEFVSQLSANPSNVVFAVVRAPSSQLDELKTCRPGNNLHILQADIVDPVALKNAAQQIADVTSGTLDFIIANAALLHHESSAVPMHAYPEGQEDVLAQDLTLFFTTNVVGTVHTLNSFLPLLSASSSPLKKAVVITSNVGDTQWTLKTHFGRGAGYGISKAAVNMVVAKYACADQFTEKGVMFMGISPGLVKTSLPNDKLTEQDITAWYDRNVAELRKVYPDFEGIVTAEASVGRMLNTIERVGLEMNGKCVGQDGESLSWFS